MLYVVIAGIGLSLLSLALPTWRRVLVFHLHAAKYLGIWMLDACRARRLWLRLAGRPYVAIDLPFLMRRFCEDMGPTFIKFGQIVASSSGMFPERFVQEFRKCLDRVRPFPFTEVQRILAEDLGQVGMRNLASIDPRPLASASIAQVHTATLRDGTPVVVKVQRPGIAAQVAADMRIMRRLAWLAERLVRNAELANPVGIVDDFATTLAEELDFRREADNLRRFNEIMAELGHGNVRAPVPNLAFTSRRVLVMERFSGTRVDRADEILARGVDAEAALVSGLRAWLQCVVLHGFFHGDVHAGNLMLLDSGDVGFLDFGIIGRFGEAQRWLVTDYMLSFSMGDYRKLAQVTVAMGGVPETLDMDAFTADLAEVYAPIRTRSFGDVNYAELLPGIQRVATRHRMRMPREFVLILKQFLYFDRYAKLLAPKLNVFTDPRLILGLLGDIQKARAGQASALRAAA
jgi:predicted unusual protein kinase regulating ubiquinone biosynthesis (AarF/ABC1/UbiB family)